MFIIKCMPHYFKTPVRTESSAVKNARSGEQFSLKKTEQNINVVENSDLTNISILDKIHLQNQAIRFLWNNNTFLKSCTKFIQMQYC